jgi:serine/threonine-protein kinase
MVSLGEYELVREIASGGMAMVHLGRTRGAGDGAPPVAIKRLHPQFARDPDFNAMLRDEARLASRIVHPNVVRLLDVVATGDEVALVMEYVAGEALSRLLRGERVPAAVASKLALDVLAGLHAAHDARDESGRRLDLVHRDVSPGNVLVGDDGLAHVIDFGIAKARGRLQATGAGVLKGKMAYMAPEQLRKGPVSRMTDVYAVGVTLWEMLVGRRPFDAKLDAQLAVDVLTGIRAPPSRFVPEIAPDVDALLLRALAREPTRRYTSALAMAEALDHALPPAAAVDVAAWSRSARVTTS